MGKWKSVAASITLLTALIGLFSVICDKEVGICSDTGPEIKICEVDHSPSGPEPENEKITLCNKGKETKDIGGWILTDNEGEYRIPPGTKIGAGEVWSVYGRTYNPSGSTHGLFLNNQHDEVILVDEDGGKVAEYSWG